MAAARTCAAWPGQNLNPLDIVDFADRHSGWVTLNVAGPSLSPAPAFAQKSQVRPGGQTGMVSITKVVAGTCNHLKLLLQAVA